MTPYRAKAVPLPGTRYADLAPPARALLRTIARPALAGRPYIRSAYFHKENPNRRGEFLHRFYGVTPDGQTFVVQIKESKKTSRKELMSVFPYT